jgi:hypothetical protein
MIDIAAILAVIFFLDRKDQGLASEDGVCPYDAIQAG